MVFASSNRTAENRPRWKGTIAESFLVPKVMVYNRKYEGHPINHANDIVLDIGYLIANKATFISQMHYLSFPVNNF